jgi:hypothetical protein
VNRNGGNKNAILMFITEGKRIARKNSCHKQHVVNTYLGRKCGFNSISMSVFTVFLYCTGSLAMASHCGALDSIMGDFMWDY